MTTGGIIPLITKAMDKYQKLNCTPQKTDITRIIPDKKIKKTEAQKMISFVVNFMTIQY